MYKIWNWFHPPPPPLLTRSYNSTPRQCCHKTEPLLPAPPLALPTEYTVYVHNYTVSCSCHIYKQSIRAPFYAVASWRVVRRKQYHRFTEMCWFFISWPVLKLKTKVKPKAIMFKITWKKQKINETF